MQRDPVLRISPTLWRTLLAELRRRTRGIHESGAFLLGHIMDEARAAKHSVYYDELDPHAYRSGVVVMHAASFGRLWELCRARGLAVVADIHVHPEGAWQSIADRDNPMIAQRGHLALILPYFAQPPVQLDEIGFFEYRGGHRWRDLSGQHVRRVLHIADEEG